MIKQLNIILILSILIITTSCVQVPLRDASKDLFYKEIIGTKYELKEDFLALGIESFEEKNQIDYFSIMPYPGIKGRYILSKKVLPKGSKFTVIGVLISEWDTCFQRTAYIIQPLDNFIGNDVRIDSSFEMLINSKSGLEPPKLNRKYFEYIKE